jgi:phosphoribosyl 1,2-cyclic phosphodiesterase
MKFEVIGSGSKGNAFLINNELLIDIGVRIPPEKAKNIKYVLLTHKHADHFNLVALRKLWVENMAWIFGGEWMSDLIPAAYITRWAELKIGKVYPLLANKYMISPIQAYHDVPNFGYRIRLLDNGYTHIHITDTATLEGIQAKNYDSASIECNHCEVKALELIEEAKEKGEFSHLAGAMNSHLSVQKAIRFVKENNIKKLYPIHIGQSTEKEVLEALRSENLI